jgi:hypothetical protein
METLVTIPKDPSLPTMMIAKVHTLKTIVLCIKVSIQYSV